MRRVIVVLGVGVSLALSGCVQVIPFEDAAPPAPAESEQERITRVCYRDASSPRCGGVLDEVSGEEVACGQSCSFGQRCLNTRCVAALTITAEEEDDPTSPPPLKLPWDTYP